MSTFTTTPYTDANAKIERGLERLFTFTSAIDDLQDDKTNTTEYIKVRNTICYAN